MQAQPTTRCLTFEGYPAGQVWPLDGEALFVRHMSGWTERIYPVDAILLTPDELVVLRGEKIVAVFDRDDVFCAGTVCGCSPSLI